MNVKRLLTLIFGLVLVSIAAKYLVLQMNPPFRLYKVAYEYNYSPTNYIQFFILFFIPSVSAIFLYRVDFVVINSFYDRNGPTYRTRFIQFQGLWFKGGKGKNEVHRGLDPLAVG